MSTRSSRRRILDRDIKALFGGAAKRCAECKRVCHVDANEQDDYVITAKIAHIIAHSDAGPRGDPSFPLDERDKYQNLILLCGDCHDKIDGQPNTYTIDYLKEKKRSHEEWVDNQLSQGVALFNFSELDYVLTALAEPQAEVKPDGFILTPPNDKLTKNELSGNVQRLIAIGMMRQHEVAELLTDTAKYNKSLPGRLTARFQAEYTRLRQAGLHGDSLFYGLLEFASQNNTDFQHRSLGLVVLTHLFLLCEVFEP